MLVAVKDSPGYVKDTETGAVINTDADSYSKFVAARNQVKNSAQLANRLTEVENDLRDIKELLQALVHRNN